jgi:CheY-like chemotaxis protein
MFVIELPADAGDGVEVATPGESASLLPQGKGERILLVDDEQAVLTMSKGMLEAYNYRVTVARDGLEALSIHREQKGAFDLVITDTMMPGMDGPTLIRYLNRTEPSLKVIAITGLADPVPPATGTGNVVGTVRKPYEGIDLLRLVASALAVVPSA